MMYSLCQGVIYFFLFFFLMGCDSDYRNTLRVSIPHEPQSLDPRKGRDLISIGIIPMVFEGLMRLSESGKAEPALAKSVKIGGEGKKYIFELRDSFWTNGEKVSSYDFAYSWKRILDPTFPAPLAHLLFMIKGAELAKDGKIPVDEVGIYTPTSSCLIVELEREVPCFLEVLSLPIFFPINSNVDRKNPNWSESEKSYVSNGPFKLSKWDRGYMIKVEKNRDYWDREAVRLEGIVIMEVDTTIALKMYEKGQLDWIGSPLSSIPVDVLREDIRKNEMYSFPYLGTCFLRCNIKFFEKKLKSKQAAIFFRKALAYCIDRKAIIEHILQGEQKVAIGIVPPSMNLSEYPYIEDGNKERARVFLDQALDLSKITSQDIELSLSYVNTEHNHLLAQVVQREWEENLQIRVRLESLEEKALLNNKKSGKYQLCLGSWIADFNDPINFLEVFKFKDKNTNDTFWENNKYIDLLDKANGSIDMLRRKEYLAKAQRILMDEMPIIPIYHMTLNYLKEKSVHKVFLSSLGHIDFKHAYKKEKL